MAVPVEKHRAHQRDERLRAALARAVRRGELAPGTRLPEERPLAAARVDDSTLGHLRLSCTQPPDVLVEGVRRLVLAWRSYLRAVDRRLSAG